MSGLTDAEMAALEAKHGLTDAELNARTKAQPYDVNPSLASAMNVGQGLTMNFGDEIFGALGGDKERYRATLEKFREEYPKTAVLGQISGAMALPFGGAGVAKLTGGMNPYVAAATLGGALGAVTAAGEAPNSEYLGNDVARGALYGAVGAPLMALGMTGGGSVLSALGSHATQLLPQSLTPKLNEILARNNVARMFNRDKIDVAKLNRDLGDEARLADYGGNNVQGALDVNASMPGQTGQKVDQAIIERQAGRPERLDPIVNAVNGGQGRAQPVFEQWQAQKEMAAGPLYARFHAQQVQADPELNGLLEIAKNRGLFKLAKERADYGMASGGQPFTLDPAAPLPKTYSPSDLDYIKRSVDQEIQRALANGDNDAVRLMNQYRKALIEKVDKSAGGTYKPALEAFSGPATLQSALQQGRRFLSDTPEALGIRMAGMSQSEQEAFRIGAAEALRQKFGGQAGQTEYMKAFRDRNIQERFQALFRTKQEYDDAMKLLNNEKNRLSWLEGVGKGSPTFKRMAYSEDQAANTAADMVGLLGAVKTGALGPLAAAGQKYSAMLGTPEAVRDQMGELLLSRNWNELKKLSEAQAALKARQLANALASSSTAAAVVGK